MFRFQELYLSRKWLLFYNNAVNGGRAVPYFFS